MDRKCDWTIPLPTRKWNLDRKCDQKDKKAHRLVFKTKMMGFQRVKKIYQYFLSRKNHHVTRKSLDGTRQQVFQKFKTRFI